jgi:hypothetical protein
VFWSGDGWLWLCGSVGGVEAGLWLWAIMKLLLNRNAPARRTVFISLKTSLG